MILTRPTESSLRCHRKAMERVEGGWIYDGAAADRLWHKSAIGKPIPSGGLVLAASELIFCRDHRHIELPSDDWILSVTNEDSGAIPEGAIMEALRVPGNKIVLKSNLESMGLEHSDETWGLRWDSDKHPRNDLPIAEIRWFTSEEGFEENDLYEWTKEVEKRGRVAESLVIDEELSVVTYRLSIAEPAGELDPPTEEDFNKISCIEYAETLTGGAFFSNIEVWPSETIGVPVHDGRQLDWVERELVHVLGHPSNDFSLEGISTGLPDPHLGMTRTASLLKELWDRGLNTRPGFKFGTTWRCYTGSVGEDHAPWLINDPNDRDKQAHDWGRACLTSRLASGVNKHWICPIYVNGGKWGFLEISRPPSDSRWSNPGKR